jgi:hypothetical protein
MDEVQKHNSFNTNTPSSESYKNYPLSKSLTEVSGKTSCTVTARKLFLIRSFLHGNITYIPFS